MRKNKIFGFILVLISFLFITNVKAENGNEVKLNFKKGIIHDGYVEYENIGKLQLFKGDVLVSNIENNMTIDLNEAEYKFVIEEIPAETEGATKPGIVRLRINNWYYPITKSILEENKFTFKLESSKFSGTLDVKFERTSLAINTKVENVYKDITSNGVIDFTNSKDYIIDFTKDDELTKGLKSFADLDKTLYYKRNNDSLLVTDNESEAVIKIVGNKSENKATLTVVNVGDKKSENFKGFHMQYTGSALDFDGMDSGIINETRFDYYTRCTYEFTFKYANEEKEIPKEITYKFLEGENQKYIINESTNARFRIDADYSLFQNGGKVYIDDILVDTNNYTSESGSTIITFKKDYVNKLNVGEHKLKVLFNNGGVAESKFTISEEKNEVKETIKNPQTVDSITTYIILSIISMVGIVITIIINNKKRKES